MSGGERCPDRVAFVTGGGHGSGWAVCLSLAREGAAVVVADLDRVAAGRVADEVGQAGGTAIAVGLHVTETASANGTISPSAKKFGRLDMLVSTVRGDAAWITGITLPVGGGILADPKASLPPPVEYGQNNPKRPDLGAAVHLIGAGQCVPAMGASGQTRFQRAFSRPLT